MKRTLSLIACGMVLAIHKPVFSETPQPISKRPKDTTEYSDYASIRGKVYQPKVFTNHDDSVASRSNGQTPNGSRGGAAPDANVNPVNCSHPVYKNMCNEIKQLIANNASAPISNLERKVAILECNTKPTVINDSYHTGCRDIVVRTDYFWSNNHCASRTYSSSRNTCGTRKDD